jgi:transposase
MNGARFVHDQLELAGFKVAIADAQKVKGLAPLACTTDRIDAWVLPRAVPPRPGPRDLAAHPLGCGPSGSGPGSGCTFTATGPRSRTASTPPCWPSASRVRSATCFGAGGRQLLAGLALPEPWIGNLTAALALIDDLDDQIDACEQQLRHLGADHP